MAGDRKDKTLKQVVSLAFGYETLGVIPRNHNGIVSP